MAVNRPTTTNRSEPMLPVSTGTATVRSSSRTRPATTSCSRQFDMEEHPQGGFHGLLEVIPTKADYILDLIRANSLWPLLSGL